MVDHRHRCSDCQRVLAEIAGSCGPRGPPPRRVRGGLRRLSGEHSPRGPPPYTAGRPYLAGLSWWGIVLAQHHIKCFANYSARMRLSRQDFAVVTDSPRLLTWLGILLSDNLRPAPHRGLHYICGPSPAPPANPGECFLPRSHPRHLTARRAGQVSLSEGRRELQRETARHRAGVLQDRTRMQFGKCYCEDAAASALSRPPLTSTPPPLLFSPRLLVKRTVYA